MYRGLPGTSALFALLTTAAVVVTGCSSGSSHPATSTSSTTSSPTATPSAAPSGGSPVAEKTGITVVGGFGAVPTVTIPAKAAPTALTEQVLEAGKGAPVAAGDVLVANYVGETWATKPTVFDSSFTRHKPAGFVIGKSQVIPGWDKTLVGMKLGSRVILTIPPVDGYGSGGNSQAGISGTDTLVFVIDLISTFKPGASAPGVVHSTVPASGWPKIANVPGKAPTITSVAGVTTPAAPASKLLVRGAGPKIVSTKTLVLQLVQTDLATGKMTQSTWTQSPQVVAASSVLGLASALSGETVGSRAVVLLPAQAATPASATSGGSAATPAAVLVIDVVGQF